MDDVGLRNQLTMLRSTLCHRIIRIHPARSSICSYSVCASILGVFHDIHGLNACNVCAIIDLFLLMHMHMHMLIFGGLSVYHMHMHQPRTYQWLHLLYIICIWFIWYICMIQYIITYIYIYNTHYLRYICIYIYTEFCMHCAIIYTYTIVYLILYETLTTMWGPLDS